MRASLTFPSLVASVILALSGGRFAQDGFVQCTSVIHALEGEVAGDQFGWVSSPVPDVTSDGVSELLVGAPFHDAGGNNSGRIYLYDGRTGTELFHADGDVAGLRLGYSVRDAGDHDGDGLGDVIVGGIGPAGGFGSARVYSSATGALLLSMNLGSTGDQFGYSVTGIGDVDMDGLPDVAVGAANEDTVANNAGRVYVISGADGSTVLRSYFGETGADNFGTALASLGDVTGDGRPELAVGAADAGGNMEGKAYVFDLQADALVYDVAATPNGGEFGQFFIASAGRINADAFPDLYVGDFAHAGGRGRAYVFDGTNGVELLQLTGQPGDGFGIGRSLGDVNGDGFDDLVLGSWTFGGSQAGKAEIYSGADGSRLRRTTSTTAGENFGFDAHGLGDVDGDGVPDMVVTAASFANSRGRVYVIADFPKRAFGSGLAGTGGLVPQIDFTGCPRPGESISVDTADVVGAAPGLLVVGSTRIDLPVFGGILYPAPGTVQQLHMARGMAGVAGDGTASLPYVLPNNPALLGQTFFLQAAYADLGAPSGVSFTQGFQVTFY